MTVEEIYIKLRDELTAENESSSSPERIFIKNEEQTICTLGMNRSHEIIFVEFKPTPKDLSEVEREPFVHPHPVEMLHDAGWRQAQITTWEEAEKLLEIIHRSYKRKRPKTADVNGRRGKRKPQAGLKAARGKAVVIPPETKALPMKKGKAQPPIEAKAKQPVPVPKAAAKPKTKPAPKPKAAAKPKAKPKSKPAAKPKAKPKAKVKAKKPARKK